MERISITLWNRSMSYLEGRHPQVVVHELSRGRRKYATEVIAYKWTFRAMVF